MLSVKPLFILWEINFWSRYRDSYSPVNLYVCVCVLPWYPRNKYCIEYNLLSVNILSCSTRGHNVTQVRFNVGCLMCQCFVWFLYQWLINLRGLLNAKALFVKEQQRFYLKHAVSDNGVHRFPKDINLKANMTARLDLELA